MLQMENEQAQLNNEQDRQQSQKNEEQARLTKEIEALQVKLLWMQKQNEGEKLENRAQIATTYSRMPAPYSAPYQAPPSWHKDFKISGQIGEPGQKDCLTFSSLAHQIEHGLSKGFPDVEIVYAVIRAITPVCNSVVT